MKIRRILSVFLLTVLMVSLMLTPQAYALPALEIKAKAAVLVDADEGRIIFGQNEQEREYPASITKVMTALLTLEAVDAGKVSLDQPITASAVVNDQDPEGSSAGIEEGEVLTVEQLLYCLLLPSANEAAQILAEAVDGDDSLTLRYRSVMGVELPRIPGQSPPPRPEYGMGDTCSELDECYLKFYRVKELTRRLAEVETSIYRLADAIKKTQKRANALQNIVIPGLDGTIRFITDALEEKERKEFARLKVIKRVTTKQK